VTFFSCAETGERLAAAPSNRTTTIIEGFANSFIWRSTNTRGHGKATPGGDKIISMLK
jgi:hypothetical protein